ncbi:hypothetical protein QPM17_14355 [Marinobacter sp. TBZ242]|uniref:Antitoxin Xre/MbcA/ParS-like toxin-binding domain-containing protein n=1 Tax=Marinobacter azerbaijanicus TaxID=3050455 RepID=A0ABT7IDT3_9GAMM|nr:hypothetical protein [Marinobacter sp. TBZ242]MDL0432323.1 hypothetical protein [Marinobacter sp. TBZ242]
MSSDFLELEAKDIIERAQPWTGSESAAWAWYRSTEIPSLGNLTAEDLVANGRGDEVRAYLDHLKSGGYS